MPWNIRLVIGLFVAGVVGALGVSAVNWAAWISKRLRRGERIERLRSRMQEAGRYVLPAFALLWVFAIGSVSFAEAPGPIIGGLAAVAGVAAFTAGVFALVYWRPTARATREIRRAAVTRLPAREHAWAPAPSERRVPARASFRMVVCEGTTPATHARTAPCYDVANVASTGVSATVPVPANLLILWTFETERVIGKIDSLLLWLEPWRAIGRIMCVRGPGFERLARPDLDAWRSGGGHKVLIRDEKDLDRRLSELATETADERGAHPIAMLSCHESTWQRAVARLIELADVLLVDLRGFTDHDAGLKYEIGQVIDRRSTAEVVFLVDGSTDMAAFRATLEHGWSMLDPASPNRHRTDAVITVQKLGMLLSETQEDAELGWNVEILGLSLNPRSRNNAKRHRFTTAGGREGERLLGLLCDGLAARRTRQDSSTA